MKRVYKIDLKHQWRSCRRILYYVYLTIPCVGVIYLIDQKFSDWLLVFLGTSVFWFALLMTIPFHIQYLIENWNTKLLIDSGLETITHQDKNGSFTYPWVDLKTERHLLRHHKPGMMKSHQPVPFDYYGYVKITTKDKRVFYITSLMADPFDFPLSIDSTRYRFPFIQVVSDDEIIRRNIQYREDEIAKFMETFEKLPDENLIYKIVNKDKFEKNAVEAAKRIVEKRRKVDTINKG